MRDPIFAAIEICRRARSFHYNLLAQAEAIARDPNATKAQRAKIITLGDRGARADVDALVKLADTAPTTRAGVLALLAFVREQYDGGDDLTGRMGDSEGPLAIKFMGSVEKYLSAKAA